MSNCTAEFKETKLASQSLNYLLKSYLDDQRVSIAVSHVLLMVKRMTELHIKNKYYPTEFLNC